MFQTLHNKIKGTIGVRNSQCTTVHVHDRHRFDDIYEIRNLTFLTWIWPDLHYKLPKISSHKNGDTERRRFWHTCLYIFSTHVVKSSDPGRSRSGHQVTSSNLTSENVWMLVIATLNDRLPFIRWSKSVKRGSGFVGTHRSNKSVIQFN